MITIVISIITFILGLRFEHLYDKVMKIDPIVFYSKRKSDGLYYIGDRKIGKHVKFHKDKKHAIAFVDTGWWGEEEDKEYIKVWKYNIIVRFIFTKLNLT